MFTPPRQLAARLRTLLAFAALGGGVLIGSWMLAGGDAGVDPALRALAASAFWHGHAEWGGWLYYGALLALAGWAQLKRERALMLAVHAYLLAQLLGSFVLVRALKIGCGRPRPAVEHAGDAFCPGPDFTDAFHAFPSSHTADAMVGAVFFVVLLRSRALAALALLPALLMGVARVASGHHHTSDVLAGAALGITFAALAIRCYLLPRLSLRASARPAQSAAAMDAAR